MYAIVLFFEALEKLIQALDFVEMQMCMRMPFMQLCVCVTQMCVCVQIHVYARRTSALQIEACSPTGTSSNCGLVS